MPLAFPPIEIGLRLTEPIDLWGCWGGLIRKVAGRCGRSALTPHAGFAFLETERFALLIGLDELASHVSDQNGWIVFQFSDCLQKTISRKQPALLFAGIADARYNAQKVQPDGSLVMV